MGTSMDRVMGYFRDISAIPRCSKNEAEIAAWLHNWADEHHFAWKADAAGNLTIQVPGRGCDPSAPILILQGHMDMVCEKTPESPHDFTRDPLTLITEGEWLRADQTTLGADNGIALALAMAAATEPALSHPPLELLFTVDEETGLTGAENLGDDMLRGKILINIDSEEEGVFTVGCAGGQHVDIDLRLSPETVAADTGAEVWEVTVGGLHGGHSGVDIHRGRANANLILAHTLTALHAEAPLRLQRFDGGSAHNAIARDAKAVVVVPPGGGGALQQSLAERERHWRLLFARTDADLSISLHPSEAQSTQGALSKADTETVLALLLAMPHGVAGVSAEWPGVVETSGNLARVVLKDGHLTLLSSLRSNVMARLDEITARVCAIARLAGAGVSTDKRYPAWEVDLDSDLLARCRQRYTSLFGREAKVAVMHAGLECGVIGAKYTGLEMISIGPTLEFPHSPQERLNLPAVEKVWTFLTALLADYASA